MLTPAQAAASRELLADALQRLPAAWADALDQRIEVEWRDDLPAQVHGRAQARRLLLDRELLDGWMARPRDAGPEDPATRAALSAVIHELAHFYDRTPQGRLSRDPRLLDLAGWQVSPMRLGLRVPENAFRDRSPDRYELENPVEFVAVNLEYFLLDPAYACRRPNARPTSWSCGLSTMQANPHCCSSTPNASMRSSTCSPKATSGR